MTGLRCLVPKNFVTLLLILQYNFEVCKIIANVSRPQRLNHPPFLATLATKKYMVVVVDQCTLFDLISCVDGLGHWLLVA